MLQFLESFLAGKEVRVGNPRVITGEERRDAAEYLVAFEQQYRLGLPGEPPPLDIEAAVWSATSLYNSAGFLIYRDQSAETIQSLLGVESPDQARSESHYAVDLTMRMLSDLIKLAKSASTDDPLVYWLMEWAQQWPLSSIGIDGVGPVDAKPLRTSSTLMRLYVDRVIATGDISRLDDPEVTKLVRVVIGDHPELCPSIAKHLEEPQASK